MTLKINRQEPITDIVNISFDVGDTEKWEHLLPGEPTHLRVDCPIPDDIDGLTKEEELSKEKHLDMPAIWVQQLHINHTGRYTIFLCVYNYSMLSDRFRRALPQRRQDHPLQASDLRTLRALPQTKWSGGSLDHIRHVGLCGRSYAMGVVRKSKGSAAGGRH